MEKQRLGFSKEEEEEEEEKRQMGFWIRGEEIGFRFYFG